MTLFVEVALIVLAGLSVLLAVRRLWAAAPARPGRRAVAIDAPPAQLLENRELIASASLSALYAHAYLRPALAESVDARLARAGFRLAAISDEVGRELLGEPLWDLVRPDRPLPADRHGPGVTAAELQAMLDVVERL